MARTIAAIQAEIITAKDAQASLAGLTSTSSTAIWRAWTRVVATAIWSLEMLFDIFRTEIDETIAKLKPHSLRWYAEKSKLFQYGYDLVEEADYYDNTGIAEDLITASKIVAYAAVVEQTRGVRIKVAKNVGSDLGALEAGELTAFTAYMKEVKDAGVKLAITSATADLLKLSLEVQYDPLVINAAGGRIDGTTSTPVKDAIREHLKNLPFNGLFSVQKLVDAIQAVEGVVDLAVTQVQTKYGALPFTTVNISRIPDAGYLRMDDADFAAIYTAV